MNPVNKVQIHRTLAVLDCTAEQVIVAVFEKLENGSFKLLGGGQAKKRGFENAKIAHLGDAVESVKEAIFKAQNSSGHRIKKIYFNIDDPKLKSFVVRGSKFLSTDSGVSQKVVEEASAAALRHALNFNESVIYSKQLQFIVDDKDTLLNPLGVFGQKLDVDLHVLAVSAQYCDDWKKIMLRAGLAQAIPVLSMQSVALGILPALDRARCRLIADLGEDFISLFVYQNNTIQSVRVIQKSDFSDDNLAQAIKLQTTDLASQYPALEQVLVTGDLSHDTGLVLIFKNHFEMLPVVVVAPDSAPTLSEARFSALVGLVSIADEMEKKIPIFERKQSFVIDAKEKVMSLVNEYF